MCLALHIAVNRYAQSLALSIRYIGCRKFCIWFMCLSLDIAVNGYTFIGPPIHWMRMMFVLIDRQLINMIRGWRPLLRHISWMNYSVVICGLLRSIVCGGERWRWTNCLPSFVLMCDGATRCLVTTRESLLSRLSDVNSSSPFLCAMCMSFANKKVDVYHW